jgi:signal transduction histidine kinase
MPVSCNSRRDFGRLLGAPEGLSRIIANVPLFGIRRTPLHPSGPVAWDPPWYYAATVRNRCAWRSALALLALLFPATWGYAQAPADPGLPLLTNIKDIRALSQDEGARGYRVHIKAVVTHVDERDDHSLIVHDGNLGQFVMPPAAPAKAGDWSAVKRGDVVEIDGHTVRGGFAPNVQPEMVKVVARSPMPAPKKIPFASMLTGRHDCDYIEVVGVVQRAWQSSDQQVRTLFADVAFEDGVVRAAFWDHTPEDLTRFIDARVRLRGNVGTIFGSTEQLRGVSLFVGRTSDVELLEGPPDPFSLPARSIQSVYKYSPRGEVNRRIRIRGVVTSYIPGRPVELSDFTSTAKFRFVRHALYVHDGTGAARIETEQPLRVPPGTAVEVAGFPAVTPGKPILTNAVFRVVGQGYQPAPVTVEGPSVLTPENDAVLVRMQGALLSMLMSPTQRVLVLKVGDTVFDGVLELEPDTPTETLEQIRPGSVIAVTGVYSYQIGPPPSFRLFLRSPDDVSVVSATSWWTLRHTAVMVVMLTFVATAGGFWMRTTAKRKRQEYQAVLNERSRVGRELHDTLEQGLAGISLQLEAVAGSLQASPEAARQSLDVARQMLRYSQEEARRSVMDLRSQAFESRDLAGALTELARQMTVGTSVLADVRVEGTPQRLDASQEHHLLRIGLEALTNAVKHAQASRIDITLEFGATSTELTVQDDGCGLEHGPQELPGDRFGLLGIRERVDKLGGVLQISGERGVGTRLSVTIPSGRRQPSDPAAPILGESWRTS